ncbi:MAG: hypothetical protein AAFX00_00445 [Pseudomonadota bacterium]
MKYAELHKTPHMPITPVSVWIGPRGWFRACRGTPHGAAIPTDPVPASYYHRKLWCMLHIHIDAVTLYFGTPLELDEVCRVLAAQPLPSTLELCRDRGSGPNSHWLSRLPKKAKTTKWRQKFLKFVSSEKKVAQFRTFYEPRPA